MLVSPHGLGPCAATGGLSALSLDSLRAPGGAPTTVPVQGGSGDGGGEGIDAGFLGRGDRVRLDRLGEGEISALQGGRHVCGM
ncbi:hypothetical protein ACRALDRAFT_2060578 [Sodiomyces alcalophilus JCM 7366]|uniref:uncharacterized protein n=1 Tax=Sodiomyces alcalophilus JCM 7366 TaxID=591952 RepID=UPI0039B6D46F